MGLEGYLQPGTEVASEKQVETMPYALSLTAMQNQGILSLAQAMHEVPSNIR